LLGLTRVQSDVSEVTKLTRLSFWQTDQRASMASPLVIGWRICEHSHAGHGRR